MATKISILSLVVGLSGLALATYVMATRPAPHEIIESDASSLGEQVALLEERMRDLERGSTDAPMLMPSTHTRDDEPIARRNEPTSRSDVEGESASIGAKHDDDAATSATVQTLVDQAVAKQVAEIRYKQRNKKPPLEKLAAILGLNERQIEETEREVVRGQREIVDVLNVVADDGYNYYDLVVEISAAGIAKVKPPMGWGEWVKRVKSVNAPGTDESFATRVESVKRSMRERFRSVWSEDQYAEYESWGVDPFQITHIEGSPGDALRERIKERADELAADADR